MRASNRSKGRLPVPPISVPLTPQEAYGSAATCINGIPREVAIPTSHSHDQSQADAQAAETATDEQSTPINILSDDLLLKVFEHLSLRSRINTERGTYPLWFTFPPRFTFFCMFTLLCLITVHYSVQTLALPAPSKLEVRWPAISE